jgi:hypothetical protein
MAEKQYALVKGTEVKNVAVFDDPTEELLELFKQEWDCDLIIETDLDPRAEAGGTWDGTKFTAKKPYDSWVLDERNVWVAPIPYPDHLEGWHVWDESNLSWVLSEDE